MANEPTVISWNDVVSATKAVRQQEYTLADYVGHETTFTNLEVRNEKQIGGKYVDRVYADAKNGSVDTHRIVLPKLDGDALITFAQDKGYKMANLTFKNMVYPAGKGGNGARLVDTSK